MTTIDERLAELGIVLPPAFPPVANYLSCSRSGDLLFVGGHGPTDGEQTIVGKVGTDLTLEQGKAAARMTARSLLATMRAELGSLDRVQQVVKVFGMVNVGGDFDQTPAVIDGCSDLLVEVFGDKGRHTRSAVGLAALPFGIAVEIELIARVDQPEDSRGI
jgi:enamine deaminase RidA (YjgF/YER057c/UK114 family)